MNKAKARSQQKLNKNIAVNPLLQNFFDLPKTIPRPTQNGQSYTIGNRPALPRSTSSAGSSRHSSPRSKTPDDDGVASDNSILVGESISLTDDEYSDAARYSPPGRYQFPIHNLQGNHTSSYAARLSSRSSAELKVDTILEGDDESSCLSKRKKKKGSALKSLKKLVGYKSPGSGKSKLSSSSRKSLASSSSFEDASTIHAHSYAGESLANQLQSLDECIPALQSKISMIRSNIISLERNLIVTRNDLARAHEHLHFATLELGELQRGAIEADIRLYNLSQQQGGMPMGQASFYTFSQEDLGTHRSSTRSTSSDRLHYLTPTSSLVDGEDSDVCYTPRSTDSYEWLSPQNSRDIIQPILGDTHHKVDVDATPLTKNSASKRSRPRSIGNVSPLTFDAISSETPSTAASTLESDDADQKPKASKVTFYKQESFIRAHDLCLADGTDSDVLFSLHTQDLGLLLDALFKRGLQSAMDESDNWTPVRDTQKILSKRSQLRGDADGPMGQWPNAASAKDVLVWSGPCTHDGHGSEYPLVKARGLIPTSALKVVELLLDSDSVKRYNKMSLGRVDEHCFSKGVDNHDRCPNTGIQGEAKIVVSKTQPPIIRKPVELRLLLHARRLHAEGESPKYISISRSIWETAEGKAEASDTSATRCEMLLSANLVRELDCGGGEKWCELTTITHAASPGGIPLSIGKRVGLAAAANYIRDIRAVFENCEA